MITPEQAEVLAQTHMQAFVNACNCGSHQDAANALMKLASVCGVGMVALVRHAEAVERMQATAEFVRVQLAGITFTQHRVN